MALTILIVEDSEDDQRLYNRALRAMGSTIVKAMSAAEGLARAAEMHPDVILLDFNLPDMDGLGFLDKFTNRGIAAVPVVMLTGEGNESIAVAAMKAGASDYLVKDVAGDYLRLLPNVIRRAHASHEGRMNARRLSELSEAILETVADGIIRIDAEGLILFANPAAERMLLSESSLLAGRHLTDFLRQADPREDWTNHPLAQSHDGSVPVYRDCDLFQRTSGTSFPVAYTASPLDYDGNGRFGWVLVFQDISERKLAEVELIKTARYDLVTGLPNRLMFQDYFAKSLRRVVRNEQHLALFFIDLDNFKKVNDSLGHLAGDQMLQVVARKMVKCLRDSDLVSRFGGDEFTILLEDCDPTQLAALAQRIIDELEVPVALGGRMVQVSASIGIVLHPECGSDDQILIHKADAAMYRAKETGKHRYCLCHDLESFLKVRESVKY